MIMYVKPLQQVYHNYKQSMLAYINNKSEKKKS